MSIWEHSHRFSYPVSQQNQLTIGEGNTLHISTSIESTRLSLKLESNNPTGSHKDRGLAYQISRHLEEGQRHFVISSSGNSVISAISLLSQRPDLSLTIYLPPTLNQSKLDRLLAQLNITNHSKIRTAISSLGAYTHNQFLLLFSNRPLSDAFKFAKAMNYVLLRGSTDPYGFEGYKTIAFEMYNKDPKIDAIFIPTSSGTTAWGIFQGYKTLGFNRPPQIHIVQTEAVNTFARQYDTTFTQRTRSIADSIVDKVGHRNREIVEAIQESHGSGWVVSDDQIKHYTTLLNGRELMNSSFEGGAAVAALIRAKGEGATFTNPVALITGHN